MARYRKIDIRIRSDARFRNLSAPSPNGQSLWFHLLTGPHTGLIPGLAGIGEAAMAEELNWPLEGFREAFREVFREGMAKADWKARLVWVPKAIRYDPPQSPNVVKSWADAWDELPECALKVEAWQGLKAFLEGKGEAFLKAFLEACPKPSPNQEQEQEQEESLSSTADAADPCPLLPIPDDAEEQDASVPLQQLQLLQNQQRFGPEDLAALWNDRAHPNLPRVSEVTGKRLEKARSRLKEHPERSWWIEVILAGNASPHCRGESQPMRGAKKPWRLNFDFLVDNDTNAVKVREGTYGSDRERTARTPQGDGYRFFADDGGAP